MNTLKRVLSASLVISTLIWAFGIVPEAFAANISTSALVNTFVLNGQTIKASSSATAVLGLNLAHSPARTLNAVQATIAGPAGFDPVVELAALATGATSGVALYADGAVAGEDGVFGSGNGDAVVAVTLPTYSAATRASALTPTQTATIVVAGTAAITPSGTYATPAVGDIVFYQSTTTAGIWANVTNATLTSGTFAVNGAALGAGTYRISKLGGGAGNTLNVTTGASGANPWTVNSGTLWTNGVTPVLGDIVQFQTGTSAPTWGVVTNATSVNQNTFAINGATLTAATAYQITKVSAFTPATSAVDASVAGKLTQGLTFAVGDLVIGTTGSGYAWGLVTTAETVAGAGTVSALRINGAAATSLFSTSTQVSKITPSGTGLATAATPTITAGDVVFASAVLNAAPLAGYNFHMATTGGAGAAGTALRLDGASAAPFWPYTVTLTPASLPAIPADNTTAGNVGSDFYIVVKTAASPTNGKQFNLSIRANADVTISDSDAVSLSSLPTNTNTITVDTMAPTVDTTTTGPANNSTGVPISAFIHIGFSENIDQSTINPTNVTFTAGGTPIPAGIRPFPNGFDVVVSSPPTFAASSRFAKVGSTSTAFYNMMGTNTIVPQPPSGYSAPTAGDIVITQRETFPPEVGVITNTTLTSGTFAVNGFTSFGGQQITKFAAPGADHTGGVGDAAKNLNVGDIIVANTSTFPSGFKYDWHMVTVAVSNAAINAGALRLDSLGSAPSFNTHPGGGASSFSAIAPTATAAVNGTSQLTLNLVQGDMVFAKVTANADNLNGYAWHLVTAAENIIGAVPNTLRLDGGSAAPTFAASSQVSKLTPVPQGPSDNTDATAFSSGDIILAKTTANASNNGSYVFHMASGGGTGITNVGLRLDNFPGSLTPSTVYVATATTGVKDSAGNPLAANNTLTFTTGATGGTNTTPPFVQSSQPQPGSQTHAIGAPIRLTFSVDMASSGGGDITASANIGLFTNVNGAPGIAVTTTKVYDSATKTVTLTPATLTASTGYVVKVNTTATSTTGTALNSPGTQPYFLFFQTPSGAADTTAPTVLGVSPANAAITISLGAIVTAGFSEDMDPSTISATTVTLKKTSNSAAVAGNVTYNPQSRSVNFSPSVALESSTGGGTNGQYTITILGGASDPRVKDLSANALAANYTSAFTTTATADTTKPFITFSGADNFSVAVTFSESMKSGGGPNAVDNISNYTLATGDATAPSLTSVGLGGKTVTYDAGTKTARINGLPLVNGNRYSITVAINAQDLAGNAMDDTGSPVKNVSQGMVQSSTTTGGFVGPGGGTIDPGMQGMNPTRVTPMSRAAGATSNYTVNFLAGTSIPSGGQIVLTFPSGFTLASADKMAAAPSGTSFCNSDINMLAGGVVGIASVAGNSDANTVTITTNTAATGTNAFMCIDLINIVNSTVPSSAGYTVTIQTKDASGVALQTLTAAPFYLGQAGSRTLTVNVFKDAGSPPNGTNDAGEGVNSVTVYLFSPATGGQEATTATNVIAGIATFTSLADGDYMIGVKPTAAIDVAFNSAPQSFTVSATNLTKNFALSNAAAITISGTITGSNGTKVDIYASSQNGFTKKTLTLDGTALAYSLPVTPNSTYNIGVGPAMSETFFTPGAPPPPPPDFTFMPPPNIQVVVAAVSVTGKNFILSTADKTIDGTVKDSAGTGVSSAGVFCRPVSNSTMGGSTVGFGTGGQTNTSGAFTLKTVVGVYLCGVFKPGMPPVPEKQITVGASANTPTTLAFVLAANTSSLTITGTVKDDSGNAIPYAGVSGRKVTSTSNTTAVGGDSSNFVGGPTDSNGAYTLYVSSNSTWVVEAFAPGFGKLGTKTISVGTSAVTGQDFSAQNTTFRTITGTATSGGTATQGVMVRAETSTGSSGNMAISAADGTYTVKVPDGTYNVSCMFPGVGDSSAVGGAITLSSSTTTAVRNCTAGTLVTVTVRITDGANGISGAGVDVRDSSGRGNSTNVSTTSTIYSVYTVKVPPGTYTVRAGHPAYGKLGETANVSADGTITYTASAGATFAVTGTVTDGTSNLSGAWVSLIGTPTGSTNKVFIGGQTASNGTFSVSVPAGLYRLRVDKPGYKSPAESTATVTAATAVGTIALALATRTITGTISITGTGAVSNAFVDASDGAGGYAVAQTDASGAYSLAVGNGTLTLRAHAPGYEGGPLPVVVNNNSPSGQNIALTAIANFTVKPEKPETVAPNTGGFLTNTDIGSQFKLNIPANALGTGSNAATVTTKVNTGMPNPPSGAILSKNAVTISAVDSSGSKVSSLNDSVTIVIPYDEANLPSGALEANLVIGTWNDATQTYDALATTVDTTANTLTATVTHFSDFAPLVPSSVSAPGTPTAFAAGNTSVATSIYLSWDAVTNAATYNVYSSTDNSTFPLLAATSSVNYTATGLTAGTVYYFKVSAVNASSAESAATSAFPITAVANSSGGGGGGAVSPAPSPSPAPKTTPSPSPTPTPGSSPGGSGSAPAGTSSYKNGSLVQVAGNSTVYLVINGTLRPFNTPAIFKARGLKFSNVKTISASQLSAQPVGKVAGYPNNTLLKGSGSTYYVVSGDSKKGIPSMAVLKKLKLSIAKAVKVSDTDLANYDDGGIAK